MKLELTPAVAVLATFFLATGAQAVPITGQITLSAELSSVAINFTTNTVAFTPSAPANNSKVDTVTGNMALLAPVGTMVSYKDFRYDPLIVIGSNPIWLTATGLSFNLTSISSITEVNVDQGLVLFGSGVVSSTAFGFDPTPGNWSFNASRTGNVFSWGSTAAAVSRVPDGGASAILLGVSLLGLVGASRKFRKI